MQITSNPRRTTQRQHRLKGKLGTHQGFEQWQYEVTGGGRIWYSIDDDNRTLRLLYASTRHPKRTDS